jgi:hypothetical protein
MELYCTPKVNTPQHTVHRFSNATPELQPIALLTQCMCPKSLRSRSRLLIPIVLWKPTTACLHCCVSLIVASVVETFAFIVAMRCLSRAKLQAVLIVVFLSCLETVLQTKNSYTLHQIWLGSVKRLKRKNSYVAYVFRRVPNSRYTKFGSNRLRG